MSIAANYLKLLFSLILISVLTECQNTDKTAIEQESLLQYVDPFIGTGFHGHTIPGAAVPYGMVQLSPDTRLNGWDASSGYHYSDSTIFGFSHTHLSGTGIGDMGDLLLLPFTDPLPESSEREKLPVAIFSHAREKASAGYYTVEFDNYEVSAELTASARVGFHRYSYGKGSEKRLLVDVGHILQRTWGHDNVENYLQIIDSLTLGGYKYSRGWSHDHKVYFRMEFSSPFSLEQWVSEGKQSKDLSSLSGKDVWAIVNFKELKDGEALLVKASISAVDEEGARKNMLAEAASIGFEEARHAAEQAWSRALEKIHIETDNQEQKTIFYTALYHTMFAPSIYQDADGRYRSMNGEIQQAEPGTMNYTAYSLWDTHRALHPLMTLIDVDKTAQWANNLLEKYQEGGILPKWPLAASYTGTMVAYPAVSVLADALSKNIPGIDAELALEAALLSASWKPDLKVQEGNAREGRLMTLHNKYVNMGRHIPADKVGSSVSYGLEMAYYDWCIAQMASMLGRDSLEARFRERSAYYKFYFDPDQGFMRGRNSDGSWLSPFNPRYSDHESSPYVEGNAWQWSWFVPHDVEGLVELLGGQEAFTARLDSLFSTSSLIEGENASGDITGLIGQYAHGNEPSHHTAYLYNYTDQAWKTQHMVDSILHAFYTSEPGGIIGNEDCGQMSAWYILSASGIYQVAPGNPVWTIGRPLFDKVEMKVGPDRNFTILTKNNSKENRYVKKIFLNGEALSDFFLDHQEIMQGGTLEIIMGAEPGLD